MTGVPVAALYGCIFGLGFVLLSAWVVQARARHRVVLGNGGVEALERRIRVHANFAEYVPLTLLLVALAELQRVDAWMLHAICLALLLGRIGHGWAVSQPREPVGRVPGMVLTLTALACAALAAGYGSLAGR